MKLLLGHLHLLAIIVIILRVPSSSCFQDTNFLLESEHFGDKFKLRHHDKPAALAVPHGPGHRNGPLDSSVTLDSDDDGPSSSSSSSSSSQSDKSFLAVVKNLNNLTRENGHDAVLKCEFRGHPRPTIEWFKNEAPIELVKGKLEVRTQNSSRDKAVSRLKVLRLDTHDTGFYKCEANSGLLTMETIGILRVEGGQYMSSKSLPSFQPVIPEFPGLMPGRVNGPQQARQRTVRPSRTPFFVLAHSSTTTTLASAMFVDHESMTSSADGDDVTFDIDGENDVDIRPSPTQSLPSYGSDTHGLPSDTSSDIVGHSDDLDFGSGFCQPYRGSVCSQFIGNASIFVQSSRSQDIMEEKLSSAFTVVATSHDISPACHRFAIPSLCFAAFPLCDEDAKEPRPRKVCRDECEMLETSICRMEYTIAKKHPLIGQKANLLPTCDQLPPAGSPEAASCLRLGVPNVVQVVHEHTCYNGNGEEYRGTAHRTVDGVECGTWTRQVFYRTSDYPEIIGGHNFCRNPGGMESQPWCFVYDGEMKKQLCDVPKCNYECEIV
ncbi:Tyrosine-protein kinase transmembrane receptor ROR2 [Halotydeus destructor]|nr:Tyrosine-protein kinase transmembrane receptor ROR2 [Halotydeus destructor]